MQHVSATNILDLPQECLFQIMRLADCNSDIRLVCKYFYEVYCGFTSCGITFGSTSTLNDGILKSMANSRRRPFKLKIDDLGSATENSIIIQRFAEHVKNLELVSKSAVRLSDIEVVLRPMVQLTELVLDKLPLKNIVAILDNPIVLEKLEKIVVKIVDPVFDGGIIDVLQSLRAVSLKEFHGMSIYRLMDYTQFFNFHKTIKRVTLSGDMGHPNAFKRLALTHLCLFGDDKAFRRNVIVHQPTLTHLNLLLGDDPDIDWCESWTRARIVDDEDFVIICGLTDLKSLRIEVGKLSLDSVAGVKNLQNLNELVVKAVGRDDEDIFVFDDFEFHSKQTLEFIHLRMFKKFIATPLPQLETFEWTVAHISFYNFDLQDDLAELADSDVFRSMAVNYPKLMNLKMDMGEFLGNFSLHEVLKSFPQLQTLSLDVDIDYVSSPLPMHTHLKRLTVNRTDFHRFERIMESLPNLKSFGRRNGMPFNGLVLHTIQTSIPNTLKHLELTFNVSNVFDHKNIETLVEIIAGLQSYRIWIIGNFNAFSEVIDPTIKRKTIKRKVGESGDFLELFK